MRHLGGFVLELLQPTGDTERAGVEQVLRKDVVRQAQLVRSLKAPPYEVDNPLVCLGSELLCLRKLSMASKNVLARAQLTWAVPDHRVVSLLGPSREAILPRLFVPESRIVRMRVSSQDATKDQLPIPQRFGRVIEYLRAYGSETAPEDDGQSTDKTIDRMPAGHDSGQKMGVFDVMAQTAQEHAHRFHLCI
ncbi:MAG: hypothetical protein ACF8GE_11560 [Phycisphaerales bacterium JB043]